MNLSIASLSSSASSDDNDDDVEFISGTNSGVNDNTLCGDFKMQLACNVPSLLSLHLDLSDSEDDRDAAFNPLDISEDEEGEDLSSVFSFKDDICSDKECNDNVNPKYTTIVNITLSTKFNKPTNVEQKDTGSNAPKLTHVFKGFINKESVSKYDVNGDDVTLINKMDSNQTILTVSTDYLYLDKRLLGWHSCYEKN